MPDRKAIKKPVTIYLSDNTLEEIKHVPLPANRSISSKCNSLISLGINKVLRETLASNEEVTFVDLFCGLGGMRIGFEQALDDVGLKGKCVFSCDIKKPAVAAYEHNFSENPYCDITKIDITNLPDFDYLLAGFPCQAFSQAGLGLGFEDTRGTLFFNVAQILKEKRPRGFLLENVEGLVNHDSGKTLKVIVSTLKQIGYTVQIEVLNAKDFGLAQSRKRVYLRGLYRKSVLPFQPSPYPAATLRDIIDDSIPPRDSPFSEQLFNHYRLEDVYGKSIKDKRGGTNNIHSWDLELKGKVTDEEKDLLEKLLRQRRNKKWAQLIGIPWMDGMPLTETMIYSFFPHPKLKELLRDLVRKGYLVYEYPKTLKEKRRVYDTSLEKGFNIVAGKLSFEYTKILDPDKLAPTLVATDVHKLAVPVLGGIRSLSISEGLALFGYPKSYSLESIHETEAFDLLGNTVCVPVIKALSQNLLASADQIDLIDQRMAI